MQVRLQLLQTELQLVHLVLLQVMAVMFMIITLQRCSGWVEIFLQSRALVGGMRQPQQDLLFAPLARREMRLCCNRSAVLQLRPGTALQCNLGCSQSSCVTPCAAQLYMLILKYTSCLQMRGPNGQMGNVTVYADATGSQRRTACLEVIASDILASVQQLSLKSCAWTTHEQQSSYGT